MASDPVKAEAGPTPKKLPIAKFFIAALIAVVAAVLVLRGVPVRPTVERGIDLIRGAGPWAFFAAMTLLPALGAPLLAFTIPAGDAFASRMTLPGVIAAALAAIAVNLALTYWLARYALRPLVARFLERRGYRVPRVTPENALSIALLVRTTPGPPYFMQGYMLGIAEVPFRLYMIVSWICMLPWSIGAIVLGRGFLNGNFKLAATGLSVLVAAIALVNWLRHKYGSRVS
jgi:uncharacterized membrane protein YdjX (TVP38/TMEM64 family)